MYIAILNDDDTRAELTSRYSERLTALQWLYSYCYFSDSVVTAEKSKEILDNQTQCVLVLDRNIFSKLLNVITCGCTNEGDTQDIAILIVWAIIMKADIWPALALSEGQATCNIPNVDASEYARFKQIYNPQYYLPWFKLADGEIDKFPYVIDDSLKDYFALKLQTNVENADFLLVYAALLHFVYVIRTEKDQIERFKSFFEWYYNTLPVSRYIEVYVIQLIVGTNNYKMPKNVNSTVFDEVVEGCKNQARDISYLTLISPDRWPRDEDEVILVTDDWMLGDIFKKGHNDPNAILMFPKRIKTNKNKISQWISDLRKNHVPVRPKNVELYYRKVIDQELTLIQGLFN